MYFVPLDLRLPTELLCIRMCAAVETQAERDNLIAAWRQCLVNGPTVRPRQFKTQPIATTPCFASSPSHSVPSLQAALSLA